MALARVSRLTEIPRDELIVVSDGLKPPPPNQRGGAGEVAGRQDEPLAVPPSTAARSRRFFSAATAQSAGSGHMLLEPSAGLKCSEPSALKISPDGKRRRLAEMYWQHHGMRRTCI